MIVVRNVFRLKFGKAREALASMKEGLVIQKRLGVDFVGAEIDEEYLDVAVERVNALKDERQLPGRGAARMQKVIAGATAASRSKPHAAP